MSTPLGLEPLLEALRRVKADGVGVRDWSLYALEGRRLRLGIKDREVGNTHAPLSIAESCSASYRLIWEDGLVSRGHLERSRLDEPLEALQTARASAFDDPDATHVAEPAEIPDVELFAPEAAAIARGDTAPIAQRLQTAQGMLRERGSRTWSGSFSAAEGRARVVTSRGLDADGRGTTVGWSLSVNGEVGAGLAGRRPEPDSAFASRLERLLRLAAELERPADPPAGGRHVVILHPSVVEEYVLDTLLHNLGGATVAHGEGHFPRELFGSDRAVLREDLGLRLDPLRPLERGSYRFTTQGLPAARCSFIERGRLVQPLLDLKYARRLGLPPTPLPYSMDALNFEGSESIELSRAMGLASALVLSVLGVHTQDSASGDFSLSAPQVLRLDAGGFAGRIRATISGNLFDLLRSPELRFVAFEGEHTPGLLVPCRLDSK